MMVAWSGLIFREIRHSHQRSERSGGLGNDTFRRILGYHEKRRFITVVIPVTQKKPIVVNVGAGHSAAGNRTGQRYCLDKRSRNAPTHVCGRVEDDRSHVAIANFDQVAGVALECELACGVVKRERAELIDQNPILCAAVAANLHRFEYSLLS